MKSMIAALALFCVIAAPVAAGPSVDKPWFDLEHCSMCKAMLAQPGLMEHMKWDNQAISTGMLSVCTVDPAYAEAYGKVGIEMQKVMKELESGKTMELCGMCMSYGALMHEGAKADEMMAGNVHIMTMTATDPKVIAGIQAHAKRTIEEYAKMKAAMGEGAGKH